MKKVTTGALTMNFIEESSTFLKICQKGKIPYKYLTHATLDESYLEMSKTYNYAAEFIINYLFKKNTSPQIIQLDSYFLPLAFLYRHSLELIIKAILIKYKGLAYTRAQIKNGFHDISTLISSISDLIEQNLNNDDEISWLYSFSNSISTFDKGSDSFRYPFKIVALHNNPNVSYKSYALNYVFETRTDIDLICMINQFKLAYYIIGNIYNGQSINTDGNCKKISPIFLSKGGAYYGKAVIGKDYDGDLSTKYIRGYGKVAELLSSDIEKFYLPICYLKRNNIELQLKNMYLSYSTSSDWNQVLENIYQKKHNIAALWKKDVQPIISNIASTKLYSPGDDIIIEEYLNNIHQFDSDAAHFRYPTNKILEPFTSKKQYDAQNMIKYIDAILNTIDGIDMIVEEYCSNANIARRHI